jgi:hypothetical protein
MRRFLRDNGLSIVVFTLFVVFVAGQSIAGLLDYKSTEREHRRPPVGYMGYLGSGDFIESVFENWESEFVAVGALAVLSIYLRQRGSSQSKPVASAHGETGG